MSAPVETPVELNAAPPVEKPIPEQETVSVEDQVSVEDWPLSIVSLLAERVTVGDGDGVQIVTDVLHGCETD